MRQRMHCNYVTIFLLLTLVLCEGCASFHRHETALSGDLPERGPNVVLMVHSCFDSSPIVGADVSLLRNDGGVVDYGDTDRFGQISIQKSLLRDSAVILICKNGFFCGAVRVKDDEILRYQSFLVHLAVFSV